MNSNGNANANNASNSNGVRPDFDSAIKRLSRFADKERRGYPSNMENTKHDVTSYENCNYQREIYDGNALYDAYRNAKKGSDWKPHVQQFEMNHLFELAKMQSELKNSIYEFLPNTEFVLSERGKTRVIHGEQIQDRVVKHALCDEILTPEIEKYLIYDNGASIKGKGVDFTRRRLEAHLHRYYMQNKNNDGYILLIDFSKYYDNIQHEILMDQFKKYIKDDLAIKLLEMTFDKAKIDVSYMNDVEYSNCLDVLFNSLDYQNIDKSLLTGDKFMQKHLNIGDQVAQIAGIMYPMKIDNYIKIVKGIKFYARYMDDSYIIHNDKAYLKLILKDIIEIAGSIGITVNTKKTRICKLSTYWSFLQTQYALTETGRIIKKIRPEKLTKMRRKMKKLANKMDSKEFKNWYDSWFYNHYKLMSKQQRKNMNELFEKLNNERGSV